MLFSSKKALLLNFYFRERRKIAKNSFARQRDSDLRRLRLFYDLAEFILRRRQMLNGPEIPELFPATVSPSGRIAGSPERCTIEARVARFFFIKHTKAGQNIPNGHTIWQMAVQYTKWT
jgi:hypothetical protein